MVYLLGMAAWFSSYYTPPIAVCKEKNGRAELLTHAVVFVLVDLSASAGEAHGAIQAGGAGDVNGAAAKLGQGKQTVLDKNEIVHGRSPFKHLVVLSQCAHIIALA
jgi:hypothetical protein